jgi:hypothetical protein
MYSLGDPKPRTEPSWPLYSFDFVDREPFGIMRFKYRSRGAWLLQKITWESLHAFCLPFFDVFNSLTVLSCFESDANHC